MSSVEPTSVSDVSLNTGTGPGPSGKTRQDLKARTKRFALDTLRYCAVLPRRPECTVVARQLMRSATSVGANYRAACRARSRADFVAKLALVEEEADECLYWFELLRDLGVSKCEQIDCLMHEANELVSIVVASRKTARGDQCTRHSTLVTRNSTEGSRE